MTSVKTTRFLPDSIVLRGLAWRAIVVVSSVVAVVMGFPVWARAPLSTAAALITVLFFIRRYRGHGLLGGVLTALGFAVAALVLLGILLNALPTGLGQASWGFGVGAIELATLIALAWWHAPRLPSEPRSRRVPVAAIVWAMAVTGVLATALLWSIASFNDSHSAPLAVGAVPSRGSVVVTVSSGRDVGPYELQLVTSKGRTLLADNIRVGPGNSLSITIKVPYNTRETVQLVRTGSTTTLRKLILDTTGSTTKDAG